MDVIDRLRGFNRRYTAQMGLLARSYLGSGLSLTEVRVLYELAQDQAVTARLLAQNLDIDEGYLSRVLSKFAGKGWVRRTKSKQDARQRELQLTDAGRAVFAPLETESRNDLADRLGDVPERVLERAAELLEAAAETLECPQQDVELRGMAVGDLGWLVQQHGELYARDEGFDDSFEPLVAEILINFHRNHDPACERAWIAALGARRLGSIFCVRLNETTAKLRLFLLLPEARGMGLGKRLLTQCISFARATGYQELQLWTHESHRAACALYAANGFELVNSTQVHSFGVDLVEQTWQLRL